LIVWATVCSNRVCFALSAVLLQRFLHACCAVSFLFTHSQEDEASREERQRGHGNGEFKGILALIRILKDGRVVKGECPLCSRSMCLF
jgi:hypothetical protein